MTMLESLWRSQWRNAAVLFCQRGCNRLLMKRGLVCLYTSTETFLQAVHQLSRGAGCRHTPCLRQQSLYSLLLGDKSSISGVVKTGSITGGLGESSRVVINHSHGDVFRVGSAEGEGVKSAAEHASSRRWQTKASCEGTLKESSKLGPGSQRDGKSLPSTRRSPAPSSCLFGFVFLKEKTGLGGFANSKHPACWSVGAKYPRQRWCKQRGINISAHAITKRERDRGRHRNRDREARFEQTFPWQYHLHRDCCKASVQHGQGELVVKQGYTI